MKIRIETPTANSSRQPSAGHLGGNIDESTIRASRLSRGRRLRTSPSTPRYRRARRASSPARAATRRRTRYLGGDTPLAGDTPPALAQRPRMRSVRYMRRREVDANRVDEAVDLFLPLAHFTSSVAIREWIKR